jgi:hypothetical protein
LVGVFAAAFMLPVGSATASPLAPGPADPGAAPAVSRTMVVGAEEDAYSVPEHPTRVTGGYRVVMVGDRTVDRRVGYLRFNLPDLAADAIVTSADLLVRATDPDPGDVSLAAYATGSSWSQTSLDLATAPQLQGQLGASVIVAGADTDIALSVADGSWSAGRSFDLALALDTAGPAKVSLAARESSTFPEARLRLTYTTTSADPCEVVAATGSACGLVVGSTVNPLDGEPSRSAALTRLEGMWGRDVAVVHTYHVDGEAFPTPEEVRWSTDPQHPRTLAINWKPSSSASWAAVAAGAVDQRIDAAAARLVDYGRPVLLAIQHEPEDNVVPAAGSGRTAADYVAMFRHVVSRMRDDGATNVSFVWDTMGYQGWGASGRYDQLYPGDDVVDWIAADPYGADLTTMLTRSQGSWPGWYAWATTRHPGKPLALFEFGMPNPRMTLLDEANAYRRLPDQAKAFPWLRLVLHFDHGADGVTTQTCRYDDDPATMQAWAAMVNDPYLASTNPLG